MAKKRTKKDSKAREEAERSGKFEIDFGIGKLSLSGMVKGLGDFIDLVEKMEREGKSEVRRTGEIKGLPPRARGIYGFTVKTGLGKKPVVESFGNIKETKAGPEVEEVREPIVDVFDEKSYILVVAELPGVKESDIKIKVSGDVLTLRAEGPRKYFKEVLLPHTPSEEAEEAKEVSFKSGILEIKFRKLPEPKKFKFKGAQKPKK